MYQDVIALRRFYYQTALGRMVQRILRDRLTAWWPPESLRQMSVAGFGFAAPMLRPYLEPARRVIALMPGQQGVMGWPAGLPNRSVLCDEDCWPLDTGSIDRLVLLHGLETARDADATLTEAWRVLGPGGRMLVMVPNRAGLWARSEKTPFGAGRSYSAGQIEGQLRAAGFVTERQAAALYVPPSDRRFWLRTAGWWEKTGAGISRMLVAGVVLAEVSKQMRAPNGPGLRVTVPSPLQVLGGMARPAGARPAANLTPDQRREISPHTGPHTKV
ncbi:MAG: hypothetical protein Q4G24_07770 [Paracoccus sp. (in: a-proteobacteria)]|uniref:class I SAM-dependent methyltransferase n=1 Tax=Paracoccus sp. TaxID=267 RepID=UPI0026DF9F75|nr:methyltransferase domain-containing protein [Paracoccus sp. (in: a-proteobacteria)]MDO5621351.1 hypothetical protein [Paracoccus sp. (in: a-proteobacteria)]